MSDPCAECFLRNRTRVPFEGPLDAAYGIVGEAPGATECRAKRPFHPDGPSGRLLSTLLRHVNIDRDHVRIGNAILCGPISDADKQNPAFKDVLARCAERRETEEDLGSVRTILAAGRMAADGLLGEQVVLGGRQPRRGALHRDAHGRAVFPTWHPAALLRSGGDNTKGGKKGGGGLSDAEVETLGFDIERSWQFANGAREEFKPEILTTLDPVIFTNWVRENVYASGVSRISLDTETDSVDATKANLLLVGIAAETPRKTIRAVSFWWPNADDVAKALLAHLLGREELQVAYQNCQYDLSVFERCVAVPKNKVFDTLLGMHAAFPEVKLDLGSIAHTFLVVPSWKFNFRQWERQHKNAVAERTPEWILRNSQYNAMDAATTLAIVDPIVRECEKRKVLQIHDIDVRLALIARKMTERGLYISPEVRSQLKVDFTEKEQRAFIKLRSIVVEGVENGLLSGRHAAEIEQLLLLVQKSSNKSMPKPRFKKEKVSKARSARKRRVKAKLLAAMSAEQQALRAVEVVQAQVAEIPRADPPPVSEPTENRPAESSLTGSDMVPEPPSVPFATPGFSSATPQASSSDVASAEVPERQRGVWIYPPPPDKVWTNKAWNPFSTNQLRLAFDICGVQLPANSLTKNGQRSMSKHALVQVFDHPLVGAVIESRKYRRFLSVYFESHGSAIGDDNRLRVGWKVHGTPTGRWSSGAGGGGVGDIGIAVQNWPPLMRKMVVAPEGYLLVGADYSALEFRMIALLSGETVLLDIFNNTTVKRDLHAENTARLYPKVWASLDPKFARDENQSEEYKARRTLMRKFVKTGFYAAVYGAVAMTVQSALRAQSLKETDPQFARMLREVSLKDCKMFVDAVPRFWPRLARWRDQQVSERARSGVWVSPIDGRRRVWLMARSERSAFINSPVQGCLVDKSRVLTNAGYRTIEDLLIGGGGNTIVWTGEKWANAKVSEQGYADLAEIVLSDGTIVRCDVRHELLTFSESGYSWASYSELKLGDVVAAPLVRELEFPSMPLSILRRAFKTNKMPVLPDNLGSELWYWLGHYVGNGYLNAVTGGFSCVFGRHRPKLAEQCRDFWLRFGVKATLREVTRIDEEGKTVGGLLITWSNRSLHDWLGELGFKPSTAHTKRLPGRVFRETRANRVEFIRGFMDADGEWPDPQSKSPNLHMCQRPILEDTKLLLRTLGIESRLVGPYTNNGFTSYRLDIFWRMLECCLGSNPSRRETGWFAPLPERVDNNLHLPRAAKLRAPRVLIDSFLRAHESRIPHIRMPEYSWSVRTLVSRLRHGGHVSVYTLEHLAKLFEIRLDLPIYVPQEIVSKREIGVIAKTYTLSVDDESHRFDADGVITKNCSGSLMNQRTLLLLPRLADLSSDIHCILQVHDSLVFEAPKDLAPQVKTIVEDTLTTKLKLGDYECLFPVEAAIGQSWKEV